MTLRFAALGSGSRGNALLVEAGDTLLMVDCGLPRRTLEQRLRQLGREPSDLAAVLITHEHGDHSYGLKAFQRRYRTPVWLTAGTGGALRGLHDVKVLNSHRDLAIGSLTVHPYPVPHDAREPCQFVFGSAGRRLGLLTDAGHVTAHMLERLGACDALALEFNHDAASLAASAYPQSVKQRIGSRFGHLNNGQSVELLRQVDVSKLQWVAGLHLSERNNSPRLVRECFAAALPAAPCPLHLASQDEPTEWIEVV